jgi:hypothetical protein
MVLPEPRPCVGSHASILNGTFTKYVDFYSSSIFTVVYFSPVLLGQINNQQVNGNTLSAV